MRHQLSLHKVINLMPARTFCRVIGETLHYSDRLWNNWRDDFYATNGSESFDRSETFCD